jgi:hypothetical protein
VIFNKSIRPIFAIALLGICLVVACESRPGGSPEAERTNAVPVDSRKTKEQQAAPLPARPMESAGRKIQRAKTQTSNPLTDETPSESALDKIDWGQETALDEFIAMAKSGGFHQVEWHVMPNIIRAQTPDGRVFHIRNESKEIDIRNTLIKAGIQVGKGGINLRYVF